MDAAASASQPLPVDGESYVSASLSWTKGQHEVSQNFTSSVSAGGVQEHAFTATGTGAASATIDWNASTTSGTWNSSVAALDTYEREITASGAGSLTASLSWPTALPNPNHDLYLVDKTTNPETILASSTALTGNSESLSYGVPSTVTHLNPKTYTLRVKAQTTGSSFTLNSTWPVTANLNLEVRRTSDNALMGSATSTSAKPETVSIANLAAGSYKVRVISADYSATYNTSQRKLTVAYQQLDWADLTFALKDPSGSIVVSQRNATGSLSLSRLVDSGGAYTLAITNHSSDLDVPTYSLPWSTTTLAHDVATGTIAASDTTQRTLTADAGGYLSADLSWTKGQHEVSSTSPASFLGGQTINTVIRPDAPGDVSATVDWDPKTVWDSDQSSVGTLGTTNYALTASGAGTIQAELSWPSGLPNPDLDLYLIDSTNVTVASSANLTGNAESLSYQVPSSVGYTTPANYTLRVQAKPQAPAIRSPGAFPRPLTSTWSSGRVRRSSHPIIPRRRSRRASRPPTSPPATIRSR